MPTYSALTTSQDALITAAVGVLTAGGYSFNPLTTSLNQYLATALTGIGGSAVSHLRMSRAQLLAGLVNGVGSGPVSHLTSTEAQLWALLASSTAAGITLSASTLNENSAQGTAVGTLAVVGGSGTYTFTLTDSAGSRFQVAGTNGVNLQAGATASNREVAASYNITVHADNGAGSTFDRTFAIAINDVNEFTPVITSDGGGATASLNVAENTTAVTTVVATDADATAVITYSISGGADAAKFTINSSTGVLAFLTAPDYEIPTDANGDNAYVVIVQASDGTNTDTQTITVTVTDVDEGGPPPSVLLKADFSSASNQPWVFW